MTLVEVDRPLVLGERPAELVGAVVAAHEVQVARRHRLQHGADRLAAG